MLRDTSSQESKTKRKQMVRNESESRTNVLGSDTYILFLINRSLYVFLLSHFVKSLPSVFLFNRQSSSCSRPKGITLTYYTALEWSGSASKVKCVHYHSVASPSLTASLRRDPHVQKQLFNFSSGPTYRLGRFRLYYPVCCRSVAQYSDMYICK